MERVEDARHIEVRQFERVVARGTQKLAWFVRTHDGEQAAWCNVAEHPHVHVEEVDAGPGSVWEKRYELSLPVGSRLLRVVSRPHPQQRPKTTLDYLRDDKRGLPRQVQRHEYRVDARGTLQRVG